MDGGNEDTRRNRQERVGTGQLTTRSWLQGLSLECDDGARDEPLRGRAAIWLQNAEKARKDSSPKWRHKCVDLSGRRPIISGFVCECTAGMADALPSPRRLIP